MSRAEAIHELRLWLGIGSAAAVGAYAALFVWVNRPRRRRRWSESRRTR